MAKDRGIQKRGLYELCKYGGNMRIGIGNDHTAVELKDIITEH